MTSSSVNKKPTPPSSSSSGSSSTSSSSKSPSSGSSSSSQSSTATENKPNLRAYSPTSTGTNSQTLGGIPSDSPIRTTGTNQPSGIQTTGAAQNKPADKQTTANGSQSGNQSKGPKTGQEWLKDLNKGQQGSGNNTARNDIRTTDSSSGRQSPQTGKDWLSYIKNGSGSPGGNRGPGGAGAPKSGQDWLNFLKNGANGLRNAFNAFRGRTAGDARGNPGWTGNTVAAFASNDGANVGYFGGQGTAMSDWAWRHGGNDVLKALYGHRHQAYPGFPSNARTQGWKSQVDGKDFFNSRFAVNQQNAANGTKMIYAGFSRGGGGDNWAFSQGIGKMNKALEKSVGGDQNLTSMMRKQATIRDMQDVFSKVRDYALKHKDQPISLVAHWNTHGNVNYDMFGNEKIKKQLLNRYFGDLKNVAIIPILESCHAGSQLVC